MTEKKKYEAPEMKAHQVKPASIICTSGSLKQNEASFESYQDASSAGKQVLTLKQKRRQ